jgi:hypothetical protein
MSLFAKPPGLLTILLFVSFSFSYSQVPQYQDDLNLSFEQSAFEGRFCVMAKATGESNYYVIDQTQLQGDFCKVYFLNLVYGDDKIVNIDPGIDNEQMWFKANIAFPIDEIICLFDDLKMITLEKDAAMTTSDKKAWLKENNKFNTKK